MSTIFRTQREKLGLEQEEVAQRAGVSVHIVKKMETGQRIGSVETRQKLAGVLGLTEAEVYHKNAKHDRSGAQPEKRPSLQEAPGETSRAELREGQIYDLIVLNRGVERRGRVAYLRTVGVNHLFLHVRGGYKECFNDIQLRDCILREAKSA